MHMGLGGCFFDGRSCRFFQAKTDIIRHGFTEQEHILRHIADLLPQAAQADVFYINTIQFQLSFLRIVHPEQQLGDSCFATAGSSNNSDLLSFVYL